MLRTIILFTALCSCMALAQPKENAEDRNLTDAAAQDGNDSIPKNISITLPDSFNIEAIVEQLQVIASNTRPDVDAERARDSYQYDSVNLQHSDLAAQKAMASYTFLMALVSVFALIVSSFGVVLLVKNLKISHQMISQDRAWITPARDDIIVRDNHRNNGRDIPLQWINTGNSPALKTRYRFGSSPSRKISRFEMARARLGDFPMEEWLIAGVVGAGQKFGMVLHISNDDLSKLANEEISRLVRIEAVYETIFSSDKRTSVAIYEISWLKESRALMVNPVSKNHDAT